MDVGLMFPVLPHSFPPGVETLLHETASVAPSIIICVPCFYIPLLTAVDPQLQRFNESFLSAVVIGWRPARREASGQIVRCPTGARRIT